MSLKVEDWRLYVGSESWDNQLGTGTLKVLGINLDAGSPTEAKQIQIVVPDNAVSRTIVETDVVRLDMYSTEAAAWARSHQLKSRPTRRSSASTVTTTSSS